MRGREGHVTPQQIGHDAALLDLALHLDRRQCDANGHGFALAKLVLEDAQGFVERIDQKIGHAVTEGLLLRGAIAGGGKRCGACDAGRYKQRAALAVRLSRVEQRAAKGRLRVSRR